MKKFIEISGILFLALASNFCSAASCLLTGDAIDPVANSVAPGADLSCAVSTVSEVQLNLIKFGICKNVPSLNGSTISLDACITLAQNKTVRVSLNEFSIPSDASIEGNKESDSALVSIPTDNYSAVYILVDNVIYHKATVKFVGAVNGVEGEDLDPSGRAYSYCSTSGRTLLDNGQTSFVRDNSGNWYQMDNQLNTSPPWVPNYVGVRCSSSQLAEAANSTEFIAADGVSNYVTGILPGLDLYGLKEDGTTLATLPAAMTSTTSDMKRILLVTTLSPALSISPTSEILMRQDFSSLGEIGLRAENGKYYIMSIDVMRGFIFVPSVR